MQLAVYAWEDVQEEALFDGLLFWVPGAANNFADLCSRADTSSLQAGLMALLDNADETVSLCRV